MQPEGRSMTLVPRSSEMAICRAWIVGKPYLGLLPACRQTLVRPVKLLKMIVWRVGNRSDRASHRT